MRQFEPENPALPQPQAFPNPALNGDGSEAGGSSLLGPWLPLGERMVSDCSAATADVAQWRRPVPGRGTCGPEAPLAAGCPAALDPLATVRSEMARVALASSLRSAELSEGVPLVWHSAGR